MNFNTTSWNVFVPDGTEYEKALHRTTHMGIGAHQDDLEIMAYDGIVKCFGNTDNWFAGIVVTNGAGSPRNGIYKNLSDEDMQKIRIQEQRKAAHIGEYGICIQLGHSSGAVKTPKDDTVIKDIAKIIEIGNPEVVYTHNLADKHDTHAAVVLRVISAIRCLPADKRPKKLYGCEVWRGLDWVCDNEKVIFDVSKHSNIAASLVGVFDSQVAGGKRYDQATAGRRQANATYLASHFVDNVSSAIYGLDMTQLIENDSLEPLEFISGYIKRFNEEVNKCLRSL